MVGFPLREVAQASQVTCEEVMVLAVTDLDVRWTTRTKAIGAVNDVSGA